MKTPINLAEERARRVKLAMLKEFAEENEQFETGVDLIIDAMIAAELSLPTTITAGCIALIDVLEISGYNRADAIKAVTEKVGLLRA